MRNVRNVLTVMMLLAVAGCATVPAGPSVMVMPAPGKSFEQFQADDAICRQWSAQQTGLSPQQVANQDTVTGAAVGTLLWCGHRRRQLPDAGNGWGSQHRAAFGPGGAASV